jgi:hypothetical protein
VSVDTLLDKHATLVFGVDGAPDDYGQPTVTETEATSGCYYRLMSTDDVDSLSRQQIDYKVYLPITLDVTGLLAIVIDGERYDVQGPAHAQWNPRLSRDEFWVLSVRRAV